MDEPVSIVPEGIKIKPEEMQVDKLYHCIYQDRVVLFYKDQNDILNCYEIEEKEIVDEVRQSKSEDVENVLKRYIEKNKLGQ